MDETVSRDLNGKPALRPRVVQGAIVAARNPSTPGDRVVFKARIDSVVALSACPQEFNPVAGWYPTDLHVGIYQAA